MKRAKSFKVLIFTKGLFYPSSLRSNVPYIIVKEGEKVDVFLQILMNEKLPKKGIYK